MIQGGIAGLLRSRTPVLFASIAGVQWALLGTTWHLSRNLLLHHQRLENYIHISMLKRPYDQLPYPRTAPPTPKENVIATTASGAFTGAAMGALLRGKNNVIPGLIMFSIFGFVGSKGYNWMDQRRTIRMQDLNEGQGEIYGHRNVGALGSTNDTTPLPGEGQGQKLGAKITEPQYENSLQRFAAWKWSPLKSLSDQEYRDMLAEKSLALEAEIALIDEAIEKIRNENMHDQNNEGGQ
jgi:hypothetical protein